MLNNIECLPNAKGKGEGDRWTWSQLVPGAEIRSASTTPQIISPHHESVNLSAPTRTTKSS